MRQTQLRSTPCAGLGSSSAPWTARGRESKQERSLSGDEPSPAQGGNEANGR